MGPGEHRRDLFPEHPGFRPGLHLCRKDGGSLGSPMGGGFGRGLIIRGAPPECDRPEPLAALPLLRGPDGPGRQRGVGAANGRGFPLVPGPPRAGHGDHVHWDQPRHSRDPSLIQPSDLCLRVEGLFRHAGPDRGSDHDRLHLPDQKRSSPWRPTWSEGERAADSTFDPPFKRLEPEGSSRHPDLLDALCRVSPLVHGVLHGFHPPGRLRDGHGTLPGGGSDGRQPDRGREHLREGFHGLPLRPYRPSKSPGDESSASGFLHFRPDLFPKRCSSLRSLGSLRLWVWRDRPSAPRGYCQIFRALLHGGHFRDFNSLRPDRGGHRAAPGRHDLRSYPKLFSRVLLGGNHRLVGFPSCAPAESPCPDFCKAQKDRFIISA